MTKYFTKEESENIISLLKSKDIESIKLGFTLLKTHPKFKNFKKLIPYNESRIYHYEKTDKKYTYKNNVFEEMKTLYDFFLKNGKCVSGSYYLESRYLLKFIKKRTK